MDVRTALSATKHFINTPMPLFQYLCTLDISRAHEHVFMLHWCEGQINGDWKSVIPMQTVASRLSLSISTVKRAYKELGELGLIRRHNQGRCRFNPMRSAVTVTEVTIPKEIESQLMEARDRRESRQKPNGASNLQEPQPPLSQKETNPRMSSRKLSRETRGACITLHDYDPTEIHGLNLAASAPITRTRRGDNLDLASRTSSEYEMMEIEDGESTDVDSKPDNCFCEAGGNRIIQSMPQAGGVYEQAPTEAQMTAPSNWRRASVPGGGVAGESPNERMTRISVLLTKALGKERKISLPYAVKLRQALGELVEDRDVDRYWHQVLWSMEMGQLTVYTVKHARNIAMKLVRTKRWTEPMDMPQGWRWTPI